MGVTFKFFKSNLEEIINQIEDYQIRIDYLQGKIEKMEKELATAIKPRLRLPWSK